MKTKPKTLAALSLALLIITLGYFLHLSNLNRDGVKTDIDFNPMNTTLPTKESMIENRPEPEIEMDTKPHPVLKVTGKQKTPDQESASTIAQMGIATEQEEMEEQVTKAQDTKIAELLEENETKHALPKPKVKVQKNEGQKSTNAAKVPDRARPPTKKPKVDISSPKNTPKDGGIKDVVDKKPKVVTEKITIAVNKPDTGKEVELSTTDSTVNSANDDVESTETDMEAEGKTVPDVKAFNPNQLPWSYDLNEGTCDYDLAFRSEFQIFNIQHHEFRLRLSDADIVKARDDWKAYAKTIKEPKIKFNRGGIVYSGYQQALKPLLISIMFLREKGCVLPIEVWHYDELDSKDIALLSKIDKVAVMNMKDYISESLDRDGGKLFSMKAAILLYTNFEEILFLDSDNIAATDPTLLFDSPAFKETGAIFWPGFTIFKLDFWKTKADNPIWQLLELECTNEYEQESGQIMIRKTPQVYKALQLTLYFQRQRGIYSELLLGDKDTFRLAWRILKVPYHMVRVNLAAVGGMEGSQFCGTSMVQYAPMWGAQIYGPPPKGYKDPESPQILFIHMNLEKLRGVSDSPNTHILMHYDPPVLPNAKNTLIGGRIGPCTWLQSCDVDESKCKVNLDQFDDFMPEFKQDYEKIIKALA